MSELLPHLGGVAVDSIECTPPGVVIRARCWPPEAACPACATRSSRVHGSYLRQVHDLPAGGQPVLIQLAMRRFVGTNPACKTVTFTGQADGLTARYQRRSLPLAQLLTQIALELAGRAGVRLAAAAGIGVHRSTLLLLDLPEPALSCAPPVVGVDDFALRRGHVYATILIDASTGRAIDVLPGREAGPLEDWLTAHPHTRAPR
jgi:transposase